MKLKYQITDIFEKFKDWTKTQSKNKIQVIKSDNGIECTSERFNRFCEDVGIKHQLTTPYTPQQNGVVEKKQDYDGDAKVLIS